MIPFYYDHANYAKATVRPTNIQPRDNAVNDYYTRYLLKRAMSVFKWNLPESWDKDYFLYVLYTLGFVAIIDTPQYGTIPQQCTLAGYDLFYRPNRALITNPNFTAKENRQYKLGVDCELIKLQPDYTGLLDVCLLYASRLSYIHEALYMNLINSKLGYVFLTDSKAAAQTFKQLFDEIQRGEPATVAGSKLCGDDGKLNVDAFFNNLKQNYIATDLLNDMRAVLNDFCSMVGIPSANTQKRERLLTDEVNANNVETETLVDIMEDTLNKGIMKANSMFGLSMSVEKRYKEKEVTSDETDNIHPLQVRTKSV